MSEREYDTCVNCGHYRSEHEQGGRCACEIVGMYRDHDCGCGEFVPGPVVRIRELEAQVAQLQQQLDTARTLRLRDDWSEDDGPVLWWRLPIREPPYCGTPLDDDYPDYVTHWTPVVLPEGTR